MDYLRQGIHLRGYAQKNPKQEYKREAFELFAQLLDKVNYDVISALYKFKIEQHTDQMEAQRRYTVSQQMAYQHTSVDVLQSVTADTVVQDEVATPVVHETYRRSTPKIGRNDPCLCGSGKKYKQCHGKLD